MSIWDFYWKQGSFFEKKQLRFVSCHKKSSHWVFRLRELVFAFDFPPWLLLFILVVILAQMLVLIIVTDILLKPVTFWNAYLQLISSVMEQSSNLFQYNSGRGRILLFCLPLMFFVLSNEHKGENITNLTVELNLTPMTRLKV